MTNAQKHPNYTQVINTIKKHSEEVARVSAAMDVKAFGAALHDDWFMIDARGQLIDKQQELALLQSSDFKPSSINVEDVHVQLHGDTAVVTGISALKAAYKGKDISGRYRFTQVYKSHGEELLDHAVHRIPKSFVMVTCITFAIDRGDPPPDSLLQNH